MRAEELKRQKKSPAATGEKGNYCGQKLFCINFPPGYQPQAGAKSRVSPFCGAANGQR